MKFAGCLVAFAGLVVACEGAIDATIPTQVTPEGGLELPEGIPELDAQTQNGEEALDFLIQDVCVDRQDQATYGDPTSCSSHRNLRIGEPIPYLRTDFWPNGGRPQALASVPVPGRDHALKVLVAKSFGGAHDASYAFSLHFDPTLDGFELIETDGTYIARQLSFTSTCLTERLSNDGWIYYDRFNDSGSSLSSINFNRPVPQPGCNALDSGHAYNVWERGSWTYGSGITLDTITSSHFAADDLSSVDNALEKVYFTKPFGFTRWESWVPLERCYRESPERCAATATNERCNGETTADFGGGAWVRVDCRDSTNISRVNTPFVPINSGTATSDVDVDAAMSLGWMRRPVVGNIDAVTTVDNGDVSVRGWACMRTLPDVIGVQLFVGGGSGSDELVAATTANLPSEPEIAELCANYVDTPHRFDVRVALHDAVRLAGRPLFVHGISTVGNPDLLLESSGTYRLPDTSVARGLIDDLYREVLGRAANAMESQRYLDQLAGGAALSDVRLALANSDEATSRLYDLAIKVLDRDPDILTLAEARSNWQELLVDGATLADVRASFARSEETRLVLVGIYGDVLLRDPTSGELTTHVNGLASGQRVIADIRRAVRSMGLRATSANPLGPFSLMPGQTVTAPNLELVFQTDGNLALYSSPTTTNRRMLWSTNTSGRDCSTNCLASFQANGELVLSQNSASYWSSHTQGTGLLLQFASISPYVRIFQGNTLVFPHMAAAEVLKPYLSSDLYRTFQLLPGEQRAEGPLSLTFLTNGNLVLYKYPGTPDQQVIWQSRTSGRSCSTGCTARFNADGSFALYQGTTSYWSTGTSGSGLLLQFRSTSPFLRIYQSSTMVYAGTD